MKISRFLTLGLLAFSLSGCTWVRSLVDDIFPPRTSSEQVAEAINTNFLALQSLNPNIGVSIESNLLEAELAAALDASVKEYEPDGVEIDTLQAEFDLARQAIAIEAAFALSFQQENLSISGSFTGIAAFSADQDAIYVRPAFDSFNIDEIGGEGASGLSRRAAKALANPMIRIFLDNINGEVFDEPIKVSLEIEDSLTVSKSEAFGTAAVEVDGEPNVIEPSLKGSSVLVSKDRMNVLLELEPNPSADSITVQPLQSQTNTARYDDLEQRFEEVWLSRLDPRNHNARIEVVFSKSVLAQFLNVGLDGPFSAKSLIPTSRERFSDTIEYDRTQIDCDKVRQPFSYERYRRRSCSWNCDATADFPPITIRDGNLGCVADRTRCNIQEEALVAADNARRETEKAAHDTAQEAAVGVCRAARAASEFVAVGRFSGEVESTGQSRLDVESLRFSEDLDGASLAFSGALAAGVKTEFSVQPYDLGYVFMCTSSVDETVRSKVAFNLRTQTTQLSFAPKPNEQDGLWLTAHINPVRYDATISPSPIIGLLADNNFSSKCRVLDTILTTAVGAGSVANDLGLIQLEPELELLIRGVATGSYEVPPFDIKIDRAEVELPSGGTPMLEPTWGTLSISFGTE